MLKNSFLFGFVLTFSLLFFAGFMNVFSVNACSEDPVITRVADNGKNATPVKLTWKMLEEIDFVEKQYKNYGIVEFPQLTDHLRQLAGKQIQLSGFVIPINLEQYAISKSQMASCFFCGEGGPETIAEITFKNKTPQLKTDQHITIQGTFRFNETNPDEWIYFIDDAFLVKK